MPFSGPYDLITDCVLIYVKYKTLRDKHNVQNVKKKKLIFPVNTTSTVLIYAMY